MVLFLDHKTSTWRATHLIPASGSRAFNPVLDHLSCHKACIHPSLPSPLKLGDCVMLTLVPQAPAQRLKPVLAQEDLPRRPPLS